MSEKNVFSRKARRLIALVLVFGVIGCILLLLEPVRSAIISFGEILIVHRPLNIPVWHSRFIRWSYTGLILITLSFGFLMLLKFQVYRMVYRIIDKIIRKYSSRLYILILLVLYAITLCTRIYWLDQKDGFHIDEGLSITLACYNDYMWTANYDFNRTYTGKEVKEISLCDNDSIKNAFGDVYRLWKTNRDPPHTNFYYSLLRLSLAGLKTGNIKDIVFRAGILNIILFSISFFVFFLLAKSLFVRSKTIPLLAVFCAFASTASVSNTLFFRPYQLQETLFIIFAYFFILFIHRRKYTLLENTVYINSSVVFIMVLITALTLLTGYYAVLFVGIFGLYIIYSNIKIKNTKEIQVYIIIFISSLLLAQVFYLQYLSGFFSDRASETLQTVWQNGFLGNVISSAAAIIRSINRYFFTIPIVALIIVLSVYLLLSKQKMLFNKLTSLLFFASCLYVIIITYIAPYKDLRYSISVFPFFVFLPASLIYSLKNRYFSGVAISLMCVFFFVNLLNPARIEYRFENLPRYYPFNEEKNIPVLVINKSNWKYATLVPYFHDEQIYFFSDNPDRIMAEDRYNEIYLVVEDSERQNIDLTNYEIESEFPVPYSLFICFKLKLK
jgi:hypothetical protein